MRHAVFFRETESHAWLRRRLSPSPLALRDSREKWGGERQEHEPRSSIVEWSGWSLGKRVGGSWEFSGDRIKYRDPTHTRASSFS